MKEEWRKNAYVHVDINLSIDYEFVKERSFYHDPFFRFLFLSFLVIFSMWVHLLSPQLFCQSTFFSLWEVFLASQVVPFLRFFFSSFKFVLSPSPPLHWLPLPSSNTSYNHLHVLNKSISEKKETR